MNNSNNKNINKLVVKVKYLDDHVDIFTVNINSLGSELFQKVSIKTKLIESYFFGLSFMSTESNLCWLDLRKAIRKQVNINDEYVYDFCVKFYTPDPNLLQDNLTKHLFVLQLKMDLSQGELLCCDSTRILLGAFFLQLWYPSSVDHDRSLLQCFLTLLFNDQMISTKLLDQMLDFYQTLKKQSAEETQYDLLETVRKIDFYGMKMHPAKDIEGMPLTLAVHHMGIVIFQKFTKINTFNWSKIRKLSFKRKRFLIKLHSEEYLELFILWVVQGFYKDTLEFYFDTRNSCKNFWKKCIEHHSFFRSNSSRQNCQSTYDKAHNFRRSFSGSRFRYVGLTRSELEQVQHNQSATNPCFRRSESAGRLMPRDYSFSRLPTASSPTISDSIHCFSLIMEPSPVDSFDDKIIEPRRCRIPVSRGNTIPTWTNISAVKQDEQSPLHLFDDSGNSVDRLHATINASNSVSPMYVLGDVSLKSQNNASLTPPINLTHTHNDTTKGQKIGTNPDNQSVLCSSLLAAKFGSYDFIPKLLAQVLLFDECSCEYPISGIDKIAHCEGSLYDGSNTRSNPSASTNSDISSCFSLLNSMVKDFLFNEFTHIKEMQVLKEMLDPSAAHSSSILNFLNPLVAASDNLIIKLELRVQITIQGLDNDLSSANHFLTILDEYFSQTLEIFRLYCNSVEYIIKSILDQTVQPNCLLSSQLHCLTKSLFHARNPLRLLLSVIFHQRNRHRCLVAINDFMVTKEEDRQLCQQLITKIKPFVSNIEELEEKSLKILLAASIEGIHNAQIRRFGWLQRLSGKGASNRLFVLTCREFLCVKKLQSNAFIVEQSWGLMNIRVGTITEFMKCTNGYSASAYPLELIAIVLCLTEESLGDSSNVVMLADSQKSQCLWISDITDAKARCTQGNLGETCLNVRCDWTQDYQLLDACWHDRVAFSWAHAKFLFQSVLSSYLLRRSKISTVWQRLWIVLADYHLYFFKGHCDREAVTSLSLIGFHISEPGIEDFINKDWVLKISKDTKTYFLRTENQYFYLRWRTALQYCTSFTN